MVLKIFIYCHQLLIKLGGIELEIILNKLMILVKLLMLIILLLCVMMQFQLKGNKIITEMILNKRQKFRNNTV